MSNVEDYEVFITLDVKRQTTKKVPRFFKPCCDVFAAHTVTCVYDIRYEWWSQSNAWVIAISEAAGGGGIAISFCPHCGKKLTGTTAGEPKGR